MTTVNDELSTDMFDVAKFVLSLFVVTIHIPLFPEYLNPLVRTAVPLFFMMSSFFFWKKARLQSEPEQKQSLFRFLKRNLRLYGFWFVVLLPITLKVRGYFSDGFAVGILKMLQSFFFYSTFRASWYIIALCTAMVVLYFLSRRFRQEHLLIFFLMIHLASCLVTNYYGLIRDCDPAIRFLAVYESIFLTFCNNFVVAMFWILLGKRFAEERIQLSHKTNIIVTLLSFVAVWVEHFLVTRFQLQAAATDYYIFLPSLCVGIFGLIRECACRCSYAKTLRKTSTIIYALHSSAIVIFSFFVRRIGGVSGDAACVWEFVSVVVFCIGVALVIMKLEEKPCFRWLKWSY